MPPADWSLAAPLIALALGYLLGSVPFGLILTRLAGLGDIRSIGSGNIGATNVLRTGNKAVAAATLAGDMLKGTAAVLIADALGFPPLVAGLGAFLGHLWPIWLRFRGGKGVATYLGVLLGLAWPFALAFAGIWLAVAFLSRYSSLAALVSSAAIPILLGLLGRPELAGLFALLAVLLWFRHAANLRRLIARTEGRIGGSGANDSSGETG